jgi:hypothetical protein
MDKKEKKYALIQVPIEVHEELKRYCNKHSFKMGRYVANLIKKSIKIKSDVHN